MAYPIKFKERVIAYRKRGYSLSELHGKFGVSKGSLSEWLRSIQLSKSARERLLSKITNGQLISSENKKLRTSEKMATYYRDARNKLNQAGNIPPLIICTLLYWCEGNKSPKGGIYFTNSNEDLIRTFLSAFRKSFSLDESKFRPCIHLHQYHSPTKQLNYWSGVTGIPKKQFIKPYLKPNTGKRIRDGYNGCVGIRYHSADIARQLLMTAKALFGKYEGV